MTNTYAELDTQWKTWCLQNRFEQLSADELYYEHMHTMSAKQREFVKNFINTYESV
jgi:hypothetical protein